VSEEVRVPENFQYLKPKQVDSLTQEAASIDKRLSAPSLLGADRGDMIRRRRKIQAMLDTQQAPDLNPQQRDAFSREARQLEEEIAAGMPSGQVMRRNPPGAVDMNLRWHERTRYKKYRLKNILRALHKGDDSPNVANLERLRKHTTPQDPPMEAAQIPGVIFSGTHPSPEYKEGWVRTFGEDAEAPASVPAAPAAQPPAEPASVAVSEKSQASTEKPKVAMRCGALKDPRGKKSHERSCEACIKLAGEPA
jgi:hypothetical protein